jgi:hypothetical protein
MSPIFSPYPGLNRIGILPKPGSRCPGSFFQTGIGGVPRVFFVVPGQTGADKRFVQIFTLFVEHLPDDTTISVFFSIRNYDYLFPEAEIGGKLFGSGSVRLPFFRTINMRKPDFMLPFILGEDCDGIPVCYAHAGARQAVLNSRSRQEKTNDKKQSLIGHHGKLREKLCVYLFSSAEADAKKSWRTS